MYRKDLSETSQELSRLQAEIRNAEKTLNDQKQKAERLERERPEHIIGRREAGQRDLEVRVVFREQRAEAPAQQALADAGRTDEKDVLARRGAEQDEARLGRALDEAALQASGHELRGNQTSTCISFLDRFIFDFGDRFSKHVVLSGLESFAELLNSIGELLLLREDFQHFASSL